MTYRQLKNARKRLGLTQLQMAALLGLTEGGYRNIELGRRAVREPIRRLVILIEKSEDAYALLEELK